MIDIELIGAPSFAVAVNGSRFTYSAINQRLVEIIGVVRADFLGRTPKELLAPDYAALVEDKYRLCVAQRRSVEFEGFYDAPGGGRWWRTVVSPVFDGEEGEVIELIGLGTDITSRKVAEQRGREVDARISLAMDLLNGGFWHYAIAQDRFSTSPQLGRLVAGADAGCLDGRRYTGFVLDQDRDALDIGPVVRGETDTSEAEYRLKTAEGRLLWVSCKRRLMRDEAGRPESVIGVVVDITEQKLRQEDLAAEAATDSLTGLTNRRGFEALGDRIAASGPGATANVGVILLDLDRFKPVNDTHGHAVGDAVLREVAARLRRHTRPGDTAVRLGGDEFAVLVWNATEDVLAGLSRRLVGVMARPISTSAGRVEIGTSVGAALMRAEDRDLGAVTARADAALLAVKRDGRGAWLIAA